MTHEDIIDLGWESMKLKGFSEKGFPNEMYSFGNIYGDHFEMMVKFGFSICWHPGIVVNELIIKHLPHGQLQKWDDLPQIYCSVGGATTKEMLRRVMEGHGIMKPRVSVKKDRPVVTELSDGGYAIDVDFLDKLQGDYKLQNIFKVSSLGRKVDSADNSTWYPFVNYTELMDYLSTHSYDEFDKLKKLAKDSDYHVRYMGEIVYMLKPFELFAPKYRPTPRSEPYKFPWHLSALLHEDRPFVPGNLFYPVPCGLFPWITDIIMHENFVRQQRNDRIRKFQQEYSELIKSVEPMKKVKTNPPVDEKKESMKDKKSGVELIAQERIEQQVKHKITIDDDVKLNGHGELRVAARTLLRKTCKKVLQGFPGSWNDETCDHMAKKSYKDRLIIAGAFIAAEIDRIQAEEE
jgi:hypothetical protein